MPTLMYDGRPYFVPREQVRATLDEIRRLASEPDVPGWLHLYPGDGDDVWLLIGPSTPVSIELAVEPTSL